MTIDEAGPAREEVARIIDPMAFDLSRYVHRKNLAGWVLNKAERADRALAKADAIDDIYTRADQSDAAPVAVTIFCPACAMPHVDEGEWATTRRHKTHQCQGCGHDWRPFSFATVGVAHPVDQSEAVRVARGALPDLSSVIAWLENGCEPKHAATELAIYKGRIDKALTQIAALGGG